jgi:hypothetical protein
MPKKIEATATMPAEIKIGLSPRKVMSMLPQKQISSNRQFARTNL